MMNFYRSSIVIFLQLFTLLAQEDSEQNVVDLVEKVSGPSLDDDYYQRLYSPLDLARCFVDIDCLIDGKENLGTLSGIRASLLIRQKGKYYLLLMQRTKNIFELYHLEPKGNMFLLGDSVRDFESPMLYERLKATLPPFRYDGVKLLYPVPATSIFFADNMRGLQLFKDCFDGIDVLFDGVHTKVNDSKKAKAYFLLLKERETYVLSMLACKNTFALYKARRQGENEVRLRSITPIRIFASAELYRRLQCRIKEVSSSCHS